MLIYIFWQRQRNIAATLSKINWLLVILVLILTFKADMITAIAKGDLKMFRSEQDSNPDLCGTCTVDTVIYQLSYTSPTGEGLLCEFMITR